MSRLRNVRLMWTVCRQIRGPPEVSLHSRLPSLCHNHFMVSTVTTDAVHSEASESAGSSNGQVVSVVGEERQPSEENRTQQQEQSSLEISGAMPSVDHVTLTSTEISDELPVADNMTLTSMEEKDSLAQTYEDGMDKDAIHKNEMSLLQFSVFRIALLKNQSKEKSTEISSEVCKKIEEANRNRNAKNLLKVYFEVAEKLLKFENSNSTYSKPKLRKRFKEFLETQEVTQLFKDISYNLSELDEYEKVKLVSHQMSWHMLSNIEEDALWNSLCENLIRLNISNVLKLYQLGLAVFKSNPKFETAVGKIKQQLQMRWIEIEKGSDIITILKIIYENQLDQAFHDRMEDRALQIVEKFTLAELQSLLSLLALKRSRNKPLCMSLTHYIEILHTESVPKNKIVQLLRDMATLSIQRVSLFSKLSNTLCSKDEPLNEKKIASVIHSCGHLRFLTPELKSLFMKRFPGLVDQLDDIGMCHILITFGKLCCIPPTDKELVTNVLKKLLKSDLKEKKPALWLNVVAAIAQSNMSMESALASVLSPEFVKVIKEKYPNMIPTLLQMQYEATVSVDGYSGKDTGNQLELGHTPKIDSLAADIHKVLRMLKMNIDSNLLNVQLPQGHTIDAVIFLNNQGSILSSDTPSGPKHKTAITIARYHNTIHPSNQLTGDMMLRMRHLSSLGYKVICIPYFKWNGLAGEASKLVYLDSELKNSLRN